MVSNDKKSVISAVYSGIIADGTNYFNDSSLKLISSGDELEKFKKCIAKSTIQYVSTGNGKGKPNAKSMPNTSDYFLNNSTPVDFSVNSVIVVLASSIALVYSEEESYSIEYSEEPTSDNCYNAYVVPGKKKNVVQLNQPLMNFCEQRALNYNDDYEYQQPDFE